MRTRICPFLVLVCALLPLHAHATATLTYQYDANGNLVAADGKYYEYNDANKLVRIRHKDASGPVIAEFVYDHTGQRIKKIEDGVTTYYIGKHFETQVIPDGQTNTKYYFANGERVAKKDALGQASYIDSDHLGSTSVVTDASGNLTERTSYYPFGEIRQGGSEKFNYTGKEKDKQTEWNYYEARYYNPQLVHFTQADTITADIYDPQALNRYSYVGNNPLRYIDPTGHTWWNPFTWFKNAENTENKNPSLIVMGGGQPNQPSNRSLLIQEVLRNVAETTVREAPMKIAEQTTRAATGAMLRNGGTAPSIADHLAKTSTTVAAGVVNMGIQAYSDASRRDLGAGQRVGRASFALLEVNPIFSGSMLALKLVLGEDAVDQVTADYFSNKNPIVDSGSNRIRSTFGDRWLLRQNWLDALQ